MFAGTALFVRLLVYAGLSLFIINGPYVYMVVCVVYAYNLTMCGLYSGVYNPDFDSSLHFTNNFRENCSLTLVILFAVQNRKLHG